MQSILSGLDDTLSSNPPATPPKTKKPKKVERVLDKVKTPNKTPKKIKIEDTLPTIPAARVSASQEDLDMAALLEGAEDWDWSDMNDFMTPKKSASPKKPKTTLGLDSPRKPLPHVSLREYRKEICTRCFVESVSEVQVKGRSQKVRSRPSHKKGR